MPTKKKPANGYPYLIRPLQADPKIFKSLHPWAVNTFFLVEALLRSPSAENAYRHGEQEFRTLFKEIPFGDDPLAGKHHVFMREGTVTRDDELDKEFNKKMAEAGFVAGDILDLKALVKLGPSAYWRKSGMAEIEDQLRSSDPRFLYLRLDVSHSASANIEALRPLLRAFHDRFMKTSLVDEFPQCYPSIVANFYKDATTFKNIKTWLDYFRCYDMRKYNFKSREIAEHVYPNDPNALTKANLAIRRTGFVIKKAEGGSWPPHRIP